VVLWVELDDRDAEDGQRLLVMEALTAKAAKGTVSTRDLRVELNHAMALIDSLIERNGSFPGLQRALQRGALCMSEECIRSADKATGPDVARLDQKSVVELQLQRLDETAFKTRHSDIAAFVEALAELDDKHRGGTVVVHRRDQNKSTISRVDVVETDYPLRQHMKQARMAHSNAEDGELSAPLAYLHVLIEEQKEAHMGLHRHKVATHGPDEHEDKEAEQEAAERTEPEETHYVGKWILKGPVKHCKSCGEVVTAQSLLWGAGPLEPLPSCPQKPHRAVDSAVAVAEEPAIQPDQPRGEPDAISAPAPEQSLQLLRLDHIDQKLESILGNTAEVKSAVETSTVQITAGQGVLKQGLDEIKQELRILTTADLQPISADDLEHPPTWPIPAHYTHLGSGNFGAVYLTNMKGNWARRIAVKVIKCDVAITLEEAEREAKTNKVLQLANQVRETVYLVSLLCIGRYICH
jgi:hypothetical protein